MNSTINAEVVYPKPVEELDEFTYYNSGDLVRKINELIQVLNEKK